MADLSITVADLKLISGPVGKGTAGATITAGQCVYKDAYTGKILLADANVAAATADCIGLSLHAALANQPIEYAMDGAIVDLGSTTAPAAGKIYIVSDTAGSLSPHSDATTPATGEFCTIVGVGIGSNRIKLAITATGVAAA